MEEGEHSYAFCPDGVGRCASGRPQTNLTRYRDHYEIGCSGLPDRYKISGSERPALSCAALYRFANDAIEYFEKGRYDAMQRNFDLAEKREKFIQLLMQRAKR